MRDELQRTHEKYYDLYNLVKKASFFPGSLAEYERHVGYSCETIPLTGPEQFLYIIYSPALIPYQSDGVTNPFFAEADWSYDASMPKVQTARVFRPSYNPPNGIAVMDLHSLVHTDFTDLEALIHFQQIRLDSNVTTHAWSKSERYKFYCWGIPVRKATTQLDYQQALMTNQQLEEENMQLRVSLDVMRKQVCKYLEENNRLLAQEQQHLQKELDAVKQQASNISLQQELLPDRYPTGEWIKEHKPDKQVLARQKEYRGWL